MTEHARDEARKLQQEWHRGYPEKKIAGVCSAIAAQLGVPLTAVRVAFVVAALPTFSFFGVLVYAAAWFLTPPEPGEPSAFDEAVAFGEDLVAGIRGEGPDREDFAAADRDRD